MAKQHTHADSVTGHLFVLGFFFLFSVGMFLLGLIGLNYFLPAGIGNPVWVWAFIVIGALGAVTFPVLLIRDWPKKPESV